MGSRNGNCLFKNKGKKPKTSWLQLTVQPLPPSVYYLTKSTVSSRAESILELYVWICSCFLCDWSAGDNTAKCLLLRRFRWSCLLEFFFVFLYSFYVTEDIFHNFPLRCLYLFYPFSLSHSVSRMNHLSFSELCCLFCCPPCPSKIASKLAFLPPEPTYSLMCDESGSRWTLHLSERADWQYSAREKDAIECFMTRTSRGNRIACMFVRCSPSARYTLLFSHGNAVDLGQMSSFYIGLGSRINCNVFSYDYSGYGASSGKPSEKNLYADVDAAWQALRSR